MSTARHYRGPAIQRPFATVLAAVLCALAVARPLPVAAEEAPGARADTAPRRAGKPVVYQVFTRLFGNQNTTNEPWGTLEQNGVGKFRDFTDKALAGIRKLGVSHIWYTGVPHHALIGDYTRYGISNDDPDVVKGRAGSPYAVKDYYSVNPDLAENPAQRLEEFRALIARTHRHGMKVLIDIVPNHVARRYESIARPEGHEDFGASDDTSAVYARDNNFYYVVGEEFRVPEPVDGYRVLGGTPHPLADGKFHESPAKWTGNGARTAQPHQNDWYETVKVNYGVRPDGTHDFERLPADYATRDYRAHHAFWKNKDVPDSWRKFRDIALYWIAMGVDGFRYDMAEMVPVEFWSYLNSAIRMAKPDAFLLAEVYDPELYRDYLGRGQMGYLYDKVGFYDTVRAIVEGREGTDALVDVQSAVADIEQHMLHFLENHDEQRIASSAFAGDAARGMPAMVVSATIGRSPTMLYFGQEVGEPAEGDPGFGDPTRTTIFDYWGVPAHQRWMNGGRFDGGALRAEERALRDFYRRLLDFTATSAALTGEYREIHRANRAASENYDERLFSFVRWRGSERLVVVSSFDARKSYRITLELPPAIVARWGLEDGAYEVVDQLDPEVVRFLSVQDGRGHVAVSLPPLGSRLFLLRR